MFKLPMQSKPVALTFFDNVDNLNTRLTLVRMDFKLKIILLVVLSVVGYSNRLQTKERAVIRVQHVTAPR